MAFCPFTSSKLFIDLSFSQTHSTHSISHLSSSISVSYSFCLYFFSSMGVVDASPATRNSLLSFHINLLGNLVSPRIFCVAKMLLRLFVGSQDSFRGYKTRVDVSVSFNGIMLGGKRGMRISSLNV